MALLTVVVWRLWGRVRAIWWRWSVILSITILNFEIYYNFIGRVLWANSGPYVPLMTLDFVNVALVGAIMLAAARLR